MFWLFDFSSPPRDPQKPGVRQISARQPRFTSAGHEAESPGQLSATSQMSAAGRQIVVAAAKPSAGHAAALPGQLSATSQSPAEARHVVVKAAKPSAGQLPAPSQDSATSQAPAEARQAVVAASGGLLQPDVKVVAAPKPRLIGVELQPDPGVPLHSS